ncbi:hypothetical protein FA95DRAFT_325145 [Auriscalpium vulgare]|uniref:Uncharacterized protein n=1 Tax=Auriscalpium vulgare TaxID=40419 RepID=A0ACB8RK93_9AGAM|nr:hypothetical protein FA95DRAFT_325145 [Auriscalpium vulgare]
MNGFQLINPHDIFPRPPFYIQTLAWLAAGVEMSNDEPSAQTSGFQSFVSDQAPNAIALIGPQETLTGYDTYNTAPFELAAPTETPSVEQALYYPPPHFYEADEPVPSSLVLDTIPTHQPINHPAWGQAYSSPYCSGLGAQPPTLSRKTTPQPLHLARLPGVPGDRQSHVQRREQRRRGPYTRSESTRSTTGGSWTPESPAFPTTPPSASSSASAHVHVLSPSGEPTWGAYTGWPPTEYTGAQETQDRVFFADDPSFHQWADPRSGSNNPYDVMPVINSGGMVPSSAGYDFGTPEIAAGVAHAPITNKFENGGWENMSLSLPVREALPESVAGASTRASTRRSKANWQSASGGEEEWDGKKTVEEKPFKCNADGCNLKYKNKGDLRRHKIMKHSKQTPEACICRWCQATFSRPDSVKRHQRGKNTKCSKKQEAYDAQISAQQAARRQSQSG